MLVLHKHASSEVSIVPEQKPEFSRYDNLAYVIYTSGSTGKPKGVMVEHATVMNFFAAMDQVIGPEKGVWLAVVNVSFDPSVLELWWSLTRGLHVVFWGGIHDVLERPIPELIQKFSVTHMTLIPSFLRTVLMLPGASESLARLRVLALGGEACPVNLVRELGHAPNRRILNFYGPTETTVVATAWEIPPNPDFMSIGRPIANTQTFVLDQQLRLKPLGAVGELYVGGSSVARGYLRRPELTDERFIKNSFSTTSDRLYRTGDLARYREDGTLEYAGRIDGQVKIRGHRVELGEIEACLGRSPEVKAAAVDVRPGSSGETRLIAYVVPRPGEPPSKRALRESLQCVLPSYMIPADFVFVGSLPCTENGKLDRHALPAPPETGTSDAELTREPTPLEAKLLLVWCEALNRKTVGLDDNFFEIGGDSLAAIALIVGIEKYFNVELPLQALFNHPTVARLSDELARLLEGNGLVQSRPDDGQPRTATERQILAIWRNLLPACRIGMRDSFFGLGGAPFFDQMLAALRDSFGAYAEAIPRGLIIEDATIEAIARMIDEQVEPVSPLVLCVQPNGHGRPLFLIHDGAGQLFFYPVLAAHLGNDRPVYGLRPPTKSHGHYRSFEKTRTVQELAELYITEIRKIRPHGPYLLGGSCFGGVIAFEMAQQLRAAGDDVGPLLLFDSFVLNNARARHMDAFTPKTFLRRFMSHIEVARRIGGLKGLVHVMLDLWTHRSIYLTKIFNALKRHTRSVAEALYKQVRNLVTKPDHMTVPANVKERILRDGWIKITERLMKRYVPHVYEGSIV
ncbi:MAG TPA: amino acid adenylation domain-containing protein, partial [Nitrospira sp.]|nr:amino acid adenylation domain-containing protein [Nitrospira sp.]